MKHVKVLADAVSIAGVLTRENVAAVRDELLAALSPSEAPRVVRLNEIAAVDSAGVQLLSSITIAYPDVQLCEPADVVHKALSRMGALRLLGGVA